MHKKIIYEDVNKAFAVRGYRLISNTYVNNNENLLFICPNGHEGSMTYRSFNSGHGCQKCGRQSRANKIRTSDEEIRIMLETDKYYLLYTESVNWKLYIHFVCDKGHKHKISLGKFKEGRRCGVCNRIRLKQTGELSISWKHSKTEDERELGRLYPGYVLWRKNVFVRDNYTCVICSNKRNLNAHHLYSYHKYKDKRVDLDNGITLCIDCHKDFHHKYGSNNNTRQQFDEYFLFRKTSMQEEA